MSSDGQDNHDFDEDDPGGDGSNGSAMLPQRYTPDRSKRVWKAYHERQALLEVDRQNSRPIFVDPIVWGELLAGNLTALIKRERNNPQSFVAGGLADRAGERCRLPELDARAHYGGVAAAAAGSLEPPKAIRFNGEEGVEFTVDFFGANGDFHEVYNRRYDGFETRSTEAGGRAAERARGKASSKEGKTEEAILRDEKPVAERQGAPWWEGDIFAGGAASALSASSVNSSGKFCGDGKKGRLGTHPLPMSIGPKTHRFVSEEVERIRQEKTMKGEHGFSDALVAHQLKDRLVVVKELDGGREGSKLREVVAIERREVARVMAKEGFADRVARRLKNASCDCESTCSCSCSIVAFENLYVRATQTAQALPTVERMMKSKEEHRREARASAESSIATDPKGTTLVVRLRPSSGGKVAAGVAGDGDSVTDTIGNFGTITHKKQDNLSLLSQSAGVLTRLRRGRWRASRQTAFASSIAVVAPDRSEERSEDRSERVVPSFDVSPTTASARVRPGRRRWWEKGRQNIALGRARRIAEGEGLESVADSITKSSTKADAPPALGSTSLGHLISLPRKVFSVSTKSITESTSEGRGWRVSGGRISGRYSVPPRHKIDLGSRKELQSMGREKRTALLIGACEWGDVEVLQRLLQLGASPLDPYFPGVRGSRCVLCEFFLFLLQVEAEMRPRLAPDDSLHERVIDELVRSQLDSDPKFLSSRALRDDGDRGFSLLHHAATFGNVRKAEFLLQRGVDPDVRANGSGETALMVAALVGRRDHLRVADALLRACADLSAEDGKGMTALHQAAFAGRKHMCHYLLLVGADRSARDHKGRTPIELCRRDAHPRVYELLRGFAACQPPPPRVILDYMEKVEVCGVEVGTALDQMRHEKVAG